MSLLTQLKPTRDLSHINYLDPLQVNPTQIIHNWNHPYTSVIIVQQTIKDDYISLRFPQRKDNISKD